MQEFINFLDRMKINYKRIDKDIHDIKKFKRENGQVYALYKDQWIRITGRNNIKFIYEIYCSECGKFLRKENIFSAAYNRSKFENNKFEYTKNFKIRCKKCSSRMNSINSREKIKQTCLKRYGVEHVFQSKDFIEHTRNTYKEKYGDNWKKVKASSMIDYWKNRVRIHHNGDNPLTRAKMVASWKITVSKKSPEDISKWRKAILSTKSKIATECLDNLSISLGLDIKREYLIGTRHVDGFIENKCIIEFYGNFWHANPEIYDTLDVIKHHGKSFSVEEIWKKDKQRINEILQIKQLPIIIIWEQSYTNNKELTIKNIKDIINNLQKTTNIYYY